MIVRSMSRVLLCCATIALVAAFGTPAVPTYAATPILWLPTPLDETWQIIQGFNCGTHTGSMGLALDLANRDGPTYDAPVRAAADGTTFFWAAGSGSLILSHGDGYYTEYTHLKSPFTTRPGVPVKQGDVIGHVGTIGTGNNPHLHFVFFRAEGPYASGRYALELEFADGYSFPNTSGCNQHYGKTVIARGPDQTPPIVTFAGTARVDEWHCKNERIEFSVSDDRLVKGFSQAFDSDPGGDEPQYLAETGYVELDWAGEGMHTLSIRAWDANGLQSLETYGPFGYDTSAPLFEAPEQVPTRTYTAGSKIQLKWQPADDGKGAGIAGYKLYLGPDPQGTSDWFSEAPQVEVPPRKAGRYLLRAQAIDAACWSSEWVTLQEVIVRASTETPAKRPTEDTAEVTDPTSTPEPTPTERPTEEATEQPTDEPADDPTETPEPTPTRAPTRTPAPTATPSPKPSATSGAVADATARPTPVTPTPRTDVTAE